MTVRDTIQQQTIAVAIAVANSDIIRKPEFAGGSFRVPTDSLINSFAFYGAFSESEDFFVVQDSDGSAITRTVAAERIVPMPTECYGVPLLKIQGDAAGTIDVFLLS